MKLEDLGYNSELENFRKEQGLDGLEMGRVIAEHKERYIVRTATGEYEAEITGNMRFTAGSREDFPAVGDWIALAIYDSGNAIIHQILPRYSMIKRQAAGQQGEIQLIAVNIDYAFVMQAADRDFNLNRLERYLTICHSAKVAPIIVLTKIDLIDKQKISEITDHIQERIEKVPVIAISNSTQEGYEMIQSVLEKGKTYCMLGSSGVGKSTLLNNLTGKTVAKTDAISHATNKGRHVTSHRELFILENGAILVDNPGMREVGMTDTAGGIETTFDKIADLSQHCRFKNCTHTRETGCAVIHAVEKGEIDRSAYENYLKLEREQAHFKSTVSERRKKEKVLGKIIKDYHKKDIKRKK